MGEGWSEVEEERKRREQLEEAKQMNGWGEFLRFYNMVG